MRLDRRILIRYFTGLIVGGALFKWRLPMAQSAEESKRDLQDLLAGSWKLRTYTYTSNNQTYSSPDQMEATAQFSGTDYSVEFAVYIGAVGVRRTRRASESGTFNVDGDMILLNAEEASADRELGEETLSKVQIDGDVMRLVSNNGDNQEVWERAPG
jgi:hypothetical protein|tara:strand:+ start:20208 stop:20678 length:471 start_codon:yes stop_codon:yes gene_type:complete